MIRINSYISIYNNTVLICYLVFIILFTSIIALYFQFEKNEQFK